MKRVLIAAAAALALTGCANMDGLIQSKQDELAQICRTEPIIHAAFVAIAADGSISKRIVQAELEAHTTIAAICANPPTDTATALATAAEAYARVLSARAKAAEQES
ncbi:cell wall anchor protein [Aureimonas fodinaquatilis]|uniref:Cell wall anchor protein n=1 Tax=Aureimonas fodinaquatilis TaxID=2565783 RepID=A0A5B0DYF1_9HYPH|nr:cell wall anchor protein [Aureimonas fodinaquatilis]KAA0970791.1 cell wall anchor protein [Aureimonas fodinaquatilis]